MGFLSFPDKCFNNIGEMLKQYLIFQRLTNSKKIQTILSESPTQRVKIPRISSTETNNAHIFLSCKFLLSALFAIKLKILIKIRSLRLPPETRASIYRYMNCLIKVSTLPLHTKRTFQGMKFVNERKDTGTFDYVSS